MPGSMKALNLLLARRLLLAPYQPNGVDEAGGANVLGVALGTVAAVFIAIVGAASFIWVRWKKGGGGCHNINVSFKVTDDKEKQRQRQESHPHAPPKPRPRQDEPAPLALHHIQVATGDFSPEGVVKETGYSSVHRAVGPQGEQWAVKRAKGLSVQGEHLFHSEVDFLAKVSHEFILPLRGYCVEGGQQMLVFDYQENGSVASWLRPATVAEANRAALTFQQRLDIAVGLADALRYLHAFKKPTIIHRDVRSDVIFLDSEFRPKLGGLGLLKHLPGEGLRLRMANRKGYLDPEYFQTYKVTPKCDVYSFGVVMLEMLTGCAPFVQVTRSAAYQPMPLPQWARQAVEAGRVREILDPRMPQTEDMCPTAMVEAFAHLACACVAPTRKDRPDMARVAALLYELVQLPEGGTLEVTALSRHTSSNRSKVVPM